MPANTSLTIGDYRDKLGFAENFTEEEVQSARQLLTEQCIHRNNKLEAMEHLLAWKKFRAELDQQDEIFKNQIDGIRKKLQKIHHKNF